MSPEQLEGKAADSRADIFAFGAVVYEMVTGRRAFQGKSRASLIAAILTSEPAAMSSLEPLTPGGLDRVVRKCLAKDPDERWQHAYDLLTELRWIGEGSHENRPAVESRGSRRRSLTWAIIALAAGAIAGALILGSFSGRPPRRRAR